MRIKTRHWICPKCTKAITVTYLDTKLSTMEAAQASQKLTQLKIQHKQAGCHPISAPSPARTTPMVTGSIPPQSQQGGGLFGSIKKLFGR